MVETTYKSKIELIDSITEVKRKYQRNKSILTFYENVSILNNDIMANVSPELYENFKYELRYVFHQSIYIDDEYTNHIVNDCINVLNLIIDALKTSNN
jgi:hypothetical protein